MHLSSGLSQWASTLVPQHFSCVTVKFSFLTANFESFQSYFLSFTFAYSWESSKLEKFVIIEFILFLKSSVMFGTWLILKFL